eukprot:5329752-Ditylum_brightwellii.AAC.1
MDSTVSGITNSNSPRKFKTCEDEAWEVKRYSRSREKETGRVGNTEQSGKNTATGSIQGHGRKAVCGSHSTQAEIRRVH